MIFPIISGFIKVVKTSKIPGIIVRYPAEDTSIREPYKKTLKISLHARLDVWPRLYIKNNSLKKTKYPNQKR